MFTIIVSSSALQPSLVSFSTVAQFIVLNPSTHSLRIRFASMASHLEQAMDQAGAHITLEFTDGLLNPKDDEQMVRISEINKPLGISHESCIVVIASPPTIGVLDTNLMALEAKATSDETNKPLLNNANEPASITSTSTSTASTNDMNLKGVKEGEGLVVSLVTTAGKRKHCFAQTDDHAAKVCKPHLGNEIKEKTTSEISELALVGGKEPCIDAAASTSTSSMDAIDMYLNGEKEKGPLVQFPTTTPRSCFAYTRPRAKPREIKTRLEIHKELHHLVKRDGTLKSGDRVMKQYLQLLDMDVPGRDRPSAPDACLALNPLLNTTKVSKIEGFMRHGGLNVLYDMLRYFLPILEGTPVLRKAMKTLQHLHGCKVLDVKCMRCEAPQFCMLKFSKLLFDLSQHQDLEVRTIAHNFQGLRFSIPQRHPSHQKCLLVGMPHQTLNMQQCMKVYNSKQ